MKKVLYVTIFATVAVTCLFACKQKSTPEETIKNFYRSYFTADFKTASNYVLEEHKAYYDLLDEFVKQEGKEDHPSIELVEVRDINCKITGDSVATCTLVLVQREVDENDSVDLFETADVIDLKKVDDVWLIDAGKENTTNVDDLKDPEAQEETVVEPELSIIERIENVE